MLRTLLRHRAGMVQTASEEIQHMHKSLDQMNVQIHRVLSDITGVSGLAIVDAILEGQRDGRELAALRDKRVRASEESIVAALEGDYRPEHLFTLRQSLESYRHYQKQIVECDRQIRQMIDELENKDEGGDPPEARKKMRTKGDEELRQEFWRKFGTDLTAIPGINTGTVEVLLGEVGADLSRFRSAGAFSMWLGLCPDNRITGGKVKSSQSRKVESRLAGALRMAAESLCRDRSYFGVFYRRMKATLDGGAPAAITAAAHKLARVIYTLVVRREAYDEDKFKAAEQRNLDKQRKRLIKQAQALGLVLVTPNTPAAALGVS